MMPVSGRSSVKRAFEEKHDLKSPLPGNWSEVRISLVEALALNLIGTMRADTILAEAQANGLEVRPPVEAGGAPNYEGAYVTVYREHRMLS